MLKKLIPLAILPLIAFAQPAEARRLFWWESVNPDEPAPPPYQDAYGNPDDQGLYGAPDQRFNEREYQLYRREMQRRYGPGVELDPPPYAAPTYAPPRTYYAQPEPTPYAPPAYVKPKPKIKKIAKAKSVVPLAKPLPPVATSAPVTAPTSAPPVEKQTATAPSSKATGPVTCEKGASIVSGLGFDKVTSKTCEAGTLAYNAERSGQPFEVDVNPKTGELIAVKKLPASKELTDKAQPLGQTVVKSKVAGQEI